jgi:hypothetical protein
MRLLLRHRDNPKPEPDDEPFGNGGSWGEDANQGASNKAKAALDEWDADNWGNNFAAEPKKKTGGDASAGRSGAGSRKGEAAENDGWDDWGRSGGKKEAARKGTGWGDDDEEEDGWSGRSGKTSSGAGKAKAGDEDDWDDWGTSGAGGKPKAAGVGMMKGKALGSGKGEEAPKKKLLGNSSSTLSGLQQQPHACEHVNMLR